MSDSTLIKASCGDHAVEVSHFEDGEVWLGLWSPIQTRDWGRLRKAWEILVHGGYGFDNDCMLSREDADELIVALDKRL